MGRSFAFGALGAISVVVVAGLGVLAWKQAEQHAAEVAEQRKLAISYVAAIASLCAPNTRAADRAFVEAKMDEAYAATEGRISWPELGKRLTENMCDKRPAAKER